MQSRGSDYGLLSTYNRKQEIMEGTGLHLDDIPRTMKRKRK